MPIQKKKVVDKRNFDFVTGALKAMDLKNATFATAIAIGENNELMVLSSNQLKDREVYELLAEAGKAVRGKSGGLILLQ